MRIWIYAEKKTRDRSKTYKRTQENDTTINKQGT